MSTYGRMFNKARGKVVVITGASSGIGRATALLFAKRGAHVVLAARRREALEEVAEQCRSYGAQALVVPTDVADEQAVEQLALRAIDAFDHFDVWVNNAGVVMYGRIEDIPGESFRQLIDTNLMGTVYGSRSAIRHFRGQHRGVLIQVSSALGMFASPYLSAYVASKFAIVGLSSALRQETRHERDIHVCTVLPAAIDTPIYQQAANYSGKAVKPMSPVVSTERVARAIVKVATRPKPQTVVGIAGVLGTLGYRAAPTLVESLVGWRAERDHFQGHAEQPHDGNVLEPSAQPSSSDGGWGHFNAAGRNVSSK